MLLFRYIFLLLVIINFSACGFQLRQSASLPQSMLNTYIETRDNRSIFSRKLKQQLLSNNAKVVDKRTNASAIIKILEDEKEIFVKLCPNPNFSAKWAELAQSQSERLKHGLAVNLDPGSLILDTFFRIEDCARTVR